jgi:WD40 repeat protein
MAAARTLVAQDMQAPAKAHAVRITLDREVEAGVPRWLSLTPDDKYLVVAGAPMVQLFGVRTLAPQKIARHVGERAEVVLDGSSLVLAVTPFSTTIKLKSMNNPAVLHTFRGNGDFRCRGDINLLAYVTRKQDVVLVDLARKKEVARLPTRAVGDVDTQSVEAISKRGTVAVHSPGLNCLLWHPPYEKNPLSLECGTPWQSAAFSSNGRYLAVGLSDKLAVQLWDVRKAKQLKLLRGSNVEDPARYVAFSPTGTFVAALGQSGELVLWSTTDFKEVARVQAHKGLTCGLVFLPDGKRLATIGVADNVMRIWTLDSANR